MPKPFEITYHAPFGGIHTQLPESIIEEQFSPNMDNVFLRNGEIRTRPALRYMFSAPTGAVVLGITSFVSNTGGLHTCLFTDQGLFEILPNSFVGNQVQISSPWQAVAGAPDWQNTFVSYLVSRGVMYMTQGADPASSSAHVSAWDGLSVNVIPDIAFTGSTYPPLASATYYGGYFIGEMAGSIVLAFTIEGSPSGTPAYALFPQRIRWSSTPFNIWGTSLAPLGFGDGLGTIGATFDGTINSTAGQADLPGVSDWITGMMTMGQVGYIFRQQGITQMSVTGQALYPFEFDHLWASKNGIGNVLFFSIAQYGNIGVFVSTDNIYQVSPSTFNTIGGGARDVIMADLANANATPSAILTPALNQGYVYLCYMLFIPMVDNAGPYVRVYAYAVEDQNWSRWTMRGATNISMPGLGWV